jgi:hypothetical protein
LPDFVNENGVEWDIVYDDRGHFTEPHTKLVIGLGTLNVRAYLSRVARLKLEGANFAPASIKTYGPHGSFSAILYVEKEGFMPLFERVKLAERYDIAIMSSKSMSVTAARELVNRIIKDTLENDTRRYRYTGTPNVIDLGLNYGDIRAYRRSGIIPKSAPSGSSKPVSATPQSISCPVSVLS